MGEQNDSHHYSDPILDDSYGERVAYWLKKWSGVRVQAPQRSQRKNDKPHRSNLCEGCKAGHCKNGDWND
ncbi:hypothetical protein GGTG_14401 [Gaeumannomyces tritici R3-111a-1]|uniref:3CxxC-type domain-containing protein n=1 Tax=Gaeumannomyces tritici (strain R3-111a-1) TaxID=644352 RepID=J3PLD5_GAET3|nr:hypothetical protein GGTG_14401 [Gaeumannomyces tritici R3-111a-1]EJT68021.1 hypothetical protein GGTG_14401 [Gaeumannomyces tritici R3-111a-1]